MHYEIHAHLFTYEYADRTSVDVCVHTWHTKSAPDMQQSYKWGICIIPGIHHLLFTGCLRLHESLGFTGQIRIIAHMKGGSTICTAYMDAIDVFVISSHRIINIHLNCQRRQYNISPVLIIFRSNMISTITLFIVLQTQIDTALEETHADTDAHIFFFFHKNIHVKYAYDVWKTMLIISNTWWN